MQVDSISFESFHWQNLKAPNFQQYWLNISVLAHDQSRRASFFLVERFFSGSLRRGRTPWASILLASSHRVIRSDGEHESLVFPRASRI